jgi:hypothetical protein
MGSRSNFFSSRINGAEPDSNRDALPRSAPDAHRLDEEKKIEPGAIFC